MVAEAFFNKYICKNCGFYNRLYVCSTVGCDYTLPQCPRCDSDLTLQILEINRGGAYSIYRTEREFGFDFKWRTSKKVDRAIKQRRKNECETGRTEETRTRGAGKRNI